MCNSDQCVIVIVVVVVVLFQGDVEKSLGWQPIPLFDRENSLELPSMQVGVMCMCISYMDFLYI